MEEYVKGLAKVKVNNIYCLFFFCLNELVITLQKAIRLMKHDLPLGNPH